MISEAVGPLPALGEERTRLKWDGEWHITYEVFRDLGIAFAAVLVLIYILVVAWFKTLPRPWSSWRQFRLPLSVSFRGMHLMGAFFTATL